MEHRPRMHCVWPCRTRLRRRLGVQPPSLYKYFPSLMALYDELFRRGQAEHLAIMRNALSAAAPGLTALTAGLEASGRWLLAHRALAQLMFWRPVPNFEPSAEAFAPSAEMVALQRAAMADAVAAGQLGPEADSDEAIDLVSTLIVGVLSQAIANEPGLGWGEGRFTTQFPRLMRLLIAAYPPRPRPQSQAETSDPADAGGPAAGTSVVSAESQPTVTVGGHT